MDITISVVTSEESDVIKHYVAQFRKKLFPMLDPNVVPFDIADFKGNYIDAPTGVFLKATNLQGQLVGVVGMMPYNNRFAYFNWPNCVVVEVARLFVEPEFRRAKVAQKLVDCLKIHAQQQGVDKLYLHTHPFLTGAFELWEKQGFSLIKTTQDSGFTTLHMTLDL